MHSESTRINALICYFLLGPFVLLARKGTPLAEPFVQGHARKSSLFFLIFAVILGIFWQFKNFLLINILGFSLYYVLLAGIIFCFFVVIFFGAFQAFRGVEAKNLWNFQKFSPEFSTTQNFSEEEKIRISLAFVPLLGIFLSAKYPNKEIFLARKVWNFALFLLILSHIFNGSVSILSFIILISYTAIIVTTGVFLLYQGKFLNFPFYNFIPTYQEFEGRIFATFQTMKEFILVAFGSEKKSTFQENYNNILTKNSEIIPPKENFCTHPAIIGIPIINIITLPSFFQEKYHEYQGNISEGFLLTILTILTFFFVKNTSVLYLFIFPIITLVAFARQNTNIRAPITSIARNIFIFFYRTKHKVNELKNSEITETYTFSQDKH